MVMRISKNLSDCTGKTVSDKLIEECVLPRIRILGMGSLKNLKLGSGDEVLKNVLNCMRKMGMRILKNLRNRARH